MPKRNRKSRAPDPEVSEVSEVTVRGVSGFFEKVVTKFGYGAKIDCPKRYLGRPVFVIVRRPAPGGEANPFPERPDTWRMPRAARTSAVASPGGSGGADLLTAGRDDTVRHGEPAAGPPIPALSGTEAPRRSDRLFPPSHRGVESELESNSGRPLVLVSNPLPTAEFKESSSRSRRCPQVSGR
ncbi:MAG: DUF2080 family transposase-associated protein [Thermoplasmata archaeon]